MHWIFIALPQLICWGSHPQCVDILRWDFWEVIPFQWGHGSVDSMFTSFLTIRGRETGTFSLAAMWRQWEGRHLQANKRGLTRKQIVWHLDLNLFVSRTVRISVYCLTNQFYDTKLWQPKLIKTVIHGHFKWRDLSLHSYLYQIPCSFFWGAGQFFPMSGSLTHSPYLAASEEQS